MFSPVLKKCEAVASKEKTRVNKEKLAPLA